MPAKKKPTKKTYLWKFLHLQDGEIVSDHDKNLSWKINEWKTIAGEIKCCDNGFHASKGILQALNYVKGDVLAKVEVKGTSDKEDDKEAWSDMRIVKAYQWTKIDSVKLAIFSAYQCIEVFEKWNPNDDRPRKAIEAAEAYIKNPTSAANAAESGAWNAANAAESAARSAAWSAANAAEQKIEKWLVSHVKNLKPITK